MTQTGKKRTAKGNERAWAVPSVAATGKVDGRRGLGLPESEGKLPEEDGAEAGRVVWEAVGEGSGRRKRSRPSVMRHSAPFMFKSIILV